MLGESGETDSGVSESNWGNVTNLCRDRDYQMVTTGIITETGPYIPVSLGFNENETHFEDGEWREVVDEYGVSTGLECKSFKVNRID